VSCCSILINTTYLANVNQSTGVDEVGGRLLEDDFYRQTFDRAKACDCVADDLGFN
jgi:hypothetical protein